MRDRSGFTLLEILIGAAVLALVGGAAMRFFHTSTQGARVARENNEFIEKGNVIRSILADPAGCQNNLAWNNGVPRSFLTSALPGVTFPIPSLTVYKTLPGSGNVTTGGVQITTSATDPGTSLWITNMSLASFFRIDDNHYYGKFTISGQHSPSGRPVSHSFDVQFATTSTPPAPAARQKVTLNSCVPGPPLTGCQNYFIKRPPNLPTESGVPILYKCATQTEMITSCRMMTYGAGTPLCSVTLGTDPTDGFDFCRSQLCPAPAPTVPAQHWAVNYVCCKVTAIR